MSVGIVVIGRNEGDRLAECLKSVVYLGYPIVYVDSGSTDGSVQMALAMGVNVVPLDIQRPFTAARARNEGFQRLTALLPELQYVQFVDGDCELVDGWLESAIRFLDAHPDGAGVCGRLRERHPERSVYNMLCDIEWDTPVGETSFCGGNVLMRVVPFVQLRGYRPHLIAGEEPELCLRLRATGWRIWRLDVEMALHDAAMVRFGQWWKRSLRNGHAFAEGTFLLGASAERHWVQETFSAWVWGLGLPLSIFFCAALVGPFALAAFAVYPLQVIRLALRGNRSTRANWWRAVFLVIGKFPEMLGQAKFISNRAFGSRSKLIEYK